LENDYKEWHEFNASINNNEITLKWNSHQIGGYFFVCSFLSYMSFNWFKYHWW
jgi:hypothetical protein